MGSRNIDGDNIIYHYIQKALLSNGQLDAFSQTLLERLLIDLSIWFPPELYRQIPVLLPYVVRDSSCRKKGEDGSDGWGTANEQGFLRDDNSLIKTIVKPLTVIGNRFKEYDKKKLANGFVASHIWRTLTPEANHNGLASTWAKTNSFVPNLVWLPRQISKLTDREGQFAQQLLQDLSRKIYAPYAPNDFNQHLWNMLPAPNLKLENNVDLNQLNYFDISTKWIKRRKTGLINELEQIRRCIQYGELSGTKVKCSAYLPSLIMQIKMDHIPSLLAWIEANLHELNRE